MAVSRYEGDFYGVCGRNYKKGKEEKEEKKGKGGEGREGRREKRRRGGRIRYYKASSCNHLLAGGGLVAIVESINIWIEKIYIYSSRD